MASVRWRGDETQTCEGQLTEIRGAIPGFERRSFAAVRRDGNGHAVNLSRDVIVRSDDEVPVGVVSKQYRLVQHSKVFDLAVDALERSEISLSEVTCQLTLTDYGERMALRVQLPHGYWLDLGDGHPMALQLQCFNSVDGSTRFMAVLGWFRFVCSNGLIVGAATSSLRSRHDERLEVEDIASVFREGLLQATSERDMYRKWIHTAVGHAAIRGWIDSSLAKEWGKKAAARAYHIIETGYDAKFVKPFERARPSERTVEHGSRVPGSIIPGRNAFAVSQALAWLAKERRDVEEQLEWSRQIGDLMKHLLNCQRGRRHRIDRNDLDRADPARPNTPPRSGGL
jgi:hypothetical protein